MKHNELVKMVSNELKARGFIVCNELSVGEGKGAVDISCKTRNENYIFHAEVKESPSTINKKKVHKQLELYKKYLGEGSDYVLISPNSKGEMVFQNLSGSYRGSLDGYLLILK